MTCCTDRGSDVISIDIRALETSPRKLFPNSLQSLTSDCWKVFNSLFQMIYRQYSGKNEDRWLATEVWFRASGKFGKVRIELRENSGKFGRQNGDDQCWKLPPEKRQIPWSTVDIVWFDRDQTLQQYVVHHVANSRRWAFRSCVGCRAQKNGLKWTKNDHKLGPKQVNFDKFRTL